MLDTPKCGWSTLRIGDWSDRCSYLDDIPVDLLGAMIESCKEHRPASVKFDAEGWEYIIIFDWQETHIITETDDGFSLTSITVDRDRLAQELISDIRRELEQWGTWLPEDLTSDELSQRKEKILGLCIELEGCIPSDDYHIVYMK